MGNCLSHVSPAGERRSGAFHKMDAPPTGVQNDATDLIEHSQVPAKGDDELSMDDLDVVFVDCDDTLYFNSWLTALRLQNAVTQFHTQRLNQDDNYALRLFEEHGTALRGLLDLGVIPPERAEEYLHAVHNVPLDEIAPNPELRAMLLRMGVRRWVLTASTREHAMRCMKRVGVDDEFEGVIDCRDLNYVVKHDAASFRIAMDKAKVTDPARCLLVDDDVDALLAAKAFGMKTCLVGLYRKDNGMRISCPQVDVEVNRLVELQDAVPLLFTPEKKFSKIGANRYSVVAARRVSRHAHEVDKPQVVFVIGGPGAGKGTQCARAAKVYDAVHMSVGDLLRDEQHKPGSPDGAIIADYIKHGKLVPIDLTIRLIVEKMEAMQAKRILLDGFPRSIENLDGWNRFAHDRCNALGVLFFDVKNHDTFVHRILERGKHSGRSDDNAEAIVMRLKTFVEASMPVTTRLDYELTLRRIDAEKSVEEVWNETALALDGWWGEVKEGA